MTQPPLVPAFYIEIHPPFWGNGTHLEVVAFPSDETLPPMTLTHLPLGAEEGDIEIVVPEGEEFAGEIFVFEFFGGSWQECCPDEDEDMNFGLTLAV